jgi:hypothetical protein
VRAQRHRLDRGRRHSELIGDEVAEPGGVEGAGHPKHALLGEAGNLGSQEGHLVEWVRDHDDDRFRRGIHDLPGHISHDAGVLLEEIHPAHPGLPGKARRDHHHVGPHRVRVVVGSPDDRLEALDRRGLVHIQSEPFRQSLDDVD